MTTSSTEAIKDAWEQTHGYAQEVKCTSCGEVWEADICKCGIARSAAVKFRDGERNLTVYDRIGDPVTRYGAGWTTTIDGHKDWWGFAIGDRVYEGERLVFIAESPDVDYPKGTS